MSGKRILAALPAAACLLALLAAVVPARAAELLDKRIDFAVEKAQAADLFRKLAATAGLKLDLDPAVRGTASLRVERVRLGTALQAACESLNCRFKVADGRLRVEALPAAKPEKPHEGIDQEIDVKVSSAGAREMCASFAD